MTQLGTLLKEARQQKGLTLEEVEEATRIRRQYLQAFESGDYAELPHPVFARGLLRSYARYLGVDPQEALAAYSQEAPRQQVQRGPTFMSEPLSTRRRLDPELLLGLVILVAVIVALVWVVREYILPLAQPSPIVPATVETPASVAVSSPGPLVSATTATAALTVTAVSTASPTVTARQIELQVILTGDTAIQVRVDGEVAFDGVLKQGDSRTWVANRAAALRVEDGSAVTVRVNGHEVGPLGAAGQGVNLVWVLGPDGKPVRLTAPGGGG